MHRKISPFDVMARAALLAALWWSLNANDAPSWSVSAPMILAATALSFWLTPAVRWPWSVVGAVQFAFFFLSHSLMGGLDVARRVFHPRLPLQPGFITYQVRLPAGAARVFFANAVSMQPGTLSAQLGETTLRVHALDTNLPVLKNIQALETCVAKMLRLTLETEAEKSS